MWSVAQLVDRTTFSLRAAGPEHALLTLFDHVPRLLRHRVWREADPEQGAGRGVLLVPGFGCGDRSLALTSLWLRARGYRPAGSRTGLNVGCTTDMLDRIERRVERHAEFTGGRVILFGQSRGGWLSRIIAARRPDLVRALVMLGSPVRNPLGVHPRAVRVARRIAGLAAAGVPGLLNRECMAGACEKATRRLLERRLPPGVPAVSVYSPFDATVPWPLCLDPAAECVEVRSSHLGMAFDPHVYVAVEPRLAEWAVQDTDARPA